MSASHFAPFKSSPSRPFDRKRAAHLLRRAGFGAAPEAVEEAVKRGLEETVGRLFEISAEEETEYQRTFRAINGHLANFGDREVLQSWWAYRMATTRTPLREKLTLFWHGHFATSDEKVENTELMHAQIETLRLLAWGNFRDLVMAIARDPAMLVWLDGESNTREHPNENFARELMELFTCGIGHYSEKDVQAAARAFTGWGRDGTRFAFRRDQHDDGPKSFLGKSGRFDGTDIIDLLMHQPATSRFLARKLLRFFAHPEPADDVVEEAAGLFDRTRLDVKWFLRDLFLSEYFHSETCFRARISSPAELVVGTVRTLGARWPGAEIVGRMNAMGQELFAPPNVKGWDGETRWINSSTWSERTQFADTISTLECGTGLLPGFDLSRIVPSDMKDTVAIVGRLVSVLMQDDLPAETTTKIAAFLIDGDGSAAERFRDDEAFREEKTRAALAMILSLPESQAY
ncbi:MAG: hypothetical protein JWN86_4255 [Planctomycetota bacterium]|nr:hypothetical protein [Planctomycetota bacterium]